VASHHAASGTDWWARIFWGWLIFVGAGEWIGDKYNIGVRALARRRQRRRKHQLALKKLELKIAQEMAGARPATTLEEEEKAAAPGPCPHRPRNIKAVIGTDDVLRSWLCTACDTQLPADWAVREEDL
jgi:hypothetical protein